MFFNFQQQLRIISYRLLQKVIRTVNIRIGCLLIIPTNDSKGLLKEANNPSQRVYDHRTYTANFKVCHFTCSVDLLKGYCRALNFEITKHSRQEVLSLDYDSCVVYVKQILCISLSLDMDLKELRNLQRKEKKNIIFLLIVDGRV